MDISQHSFEDICKKIASKEPTPGGGAVSALVSAIAASLVAKVAIFSQKASLAESWFEKVKQIHLVSLKQMEILDNLAQADIQAYNDFSQTKKPEKKPVVVKRIINVPLEIAKQSVIILQNADFMAKKGNQRLISDSHCALELATAAFYSALETLRINLPILSQLDQVNDNFETETRKEIDHLLEVVEKITKP